MIKYFLLLLFPFFLSAQIIDADSFGIDNTRHIIVINKNIDDLNNSIPGMKDYLNLGGTVFTFGTPVENFVKGTAYNVTANDTLYKLFFSNLPIIKMTTEGTISDTPAILGHFELLVPGETKISSLIGVEYRGASSQAYPKKSMEIEFWKDEAGNETQDFSLLGMFEEDGANLQAMYIEKLRINSKTGNDLWKEIHPDVYYKDKEEDARSGILMKYTDLFLNGEYRGIYAIGEKVKRKILKLKKFDNEIKGELYKGDSWGRATMLTGVDSYNNSSDYWSGYEYKHPKELIDWSNVHSFVSFVVNSDKTTFDNTYSQKIDVDNMLDYFIFMNLIRAIDNTGKNIYLAKYKKNEPYFYVPWDLDGTFGTYWDGSNQNVYNDILFNGLYTRLWENHDFRVKLTNRWNELRTSIITEEHIGNMLTNNYLELKDNGTYDREKMVWSGFPFSPTQLQYHTTWVKNRITYLDTVFASYMGVSDSGLKEKELKLFPNPISEYFSIDTAELKNAELKIIDFSGRELQKQNFETLNSKTKISVSNLSSGVYFVILKTKDSIHTSRLIIKKK